MKRKKKLLKKIEKMSLKIKELKNENRLLRKDLVSLSEQELSLQLALAYYREMVSEASDNTLAIRDILWNGDETTIFWCDNTTTTVKKAAEDTYDRATAVAFCIAKKVLVGGISGTVEYYSEEAKRRRKEVRAAAKVYRCLKGRGGYAAKKVAEEKWSEIPHGIKQAVKERNRAGRQS